MRQEISLDNIIKEVSNINKDEDNLSVYYIWEVKKAMKEAINQALNLAANNAKLEYLNLETGKIVTERDSEDEDVYVASGVNKNSILEIKDWIK